MMVVMLLLPLVVWVTVEPRVETSRDEDIEWLR